MLHDFNRATPTSAVGAWEAFDWLITAPARSPLVRLLGRARRHGWLAAAIGLPALAVAVAPWAGHGEAPDGDTARLATIAPPPIERPFAPAALRALSVEEATEWNAAAAVSGNPPPVAAAFSLGAAAASDYGRSHECLAMAIYYEAGNEPVEGGRAVAQVVLNRVRHPSYPRTVCGVIFEGAQRKTGCQFTFACDGSLARVPAGAAWRRARAIATDALAGKVYAPVGWATHYHADYVVPYWATSLDKVTTVGAHIFYRWAGRWGQPAAFAARYAGGEPALPFALSALDAPALPPADEAPPEGRAAKELERPVLLPGVAAGPEGAEAPSRGSPARDVALRDRRILPHTSGLVGEPAGGA